MLKIFQKFFMKNLDYKKEEYRGTIKQIMKVRGLRTISLANYNAWLENPVNEESGIHSLKLNLQDGYVNIYGYRRTKTNKLVCGDVIDNAPASLYKEAYDQVNEIIKNEARIPMKVRKNILVGLCR
jgi:hypothetical protein